jgi:hypothetical protein
LWSGALGGGAELVAGGGGAVVVIVLVTSISSRDAGARATGEAKSHCRGIAARFRHNRSIGYNPTLDHARRASEQAARTR